jgi:predicted amidohydrolase YtcJ
VAVAFGSDWPVMPAEPLATMHTAVNSDNLTLPSGALWGPGASVSPEEALQAHTVGGAVACNLESEVGVLRYAQLLAVVFNGTSVQPSWLAEITNPPPPCSIAFNICF